MVARGKASSGSINKVAGCLLFLLAVEASEWQTVVAGGVMHPLAVKASSCGIPATGECPVQAEADQASSDGAIEMTRGSLQPEPARPAAVAPLRRWGACSAP